MDPLATRISALLREEAHIAECWLVEFVLGNRNGCRYLTAQLAEVEDQRRRLERKLRR